MAAIRISELDLWNTEKLMGQIAHLEQMIDRMTLSEKDTEFFLQAAGRLDNVLRAAGYVTDEEQRDILKQATGRSVAVDDFLGMAITRLFGRMERANHFDSVLRELENGGALIVQSSVPYVPPMDGTGIQAGEGDDAVKYEIKTEPRLSWMVQALRDIGIYADDMIIRVGRVDPNGMRKYPYIVIDIPRVEKQVALCEQVGNRTFVSTEILDPAAYERLTKDLLQTLPSVTGIRMSPTWAAQICALLKGDEGASVPSRKVPNLPFYESARKPKSIPLTEAMIIDACKKWHAEHEKWPTQMSGDIVSGVLAGNTWKAINLALRNGSRGLTSGQYTGLSDFMEVQGLKVSRISASRSLTEAMIVQGCNEWHAAHGQWPIQVSGNIVSGVLAGNNWAAINLALRNGSRGLPSGQYAGLADFMEGHGLKVNRKSTSRYLTEAMILQGCNEWYAEHGQWPTKESGDIVSGVLAGNSWGAINLVLRKGSRGLTPGRYTGLGDFKIKNGLGNVVANVASKGQAEDVTAPPQLSQPPRPPALG